MFSPHSIGHFDFVGCFLYCAEAFEFNGVLLFSFGFCCFCCQIQKLLLKPVSNSLLPKAFFLDVLWFQVLHSCLNLFQANFCVWFKMGAWFNFLHAAMQFYSTVYWEGSSTPCFSRDNGGKCLCDHLTTALFAAVLWDLWTQATLALRMRWLQGACPRGSLKRER